MFPQYDATATSAAQTISVTVTALTRPSVFDRASETPSPPINNSAVPTLDTPTITQYILSSLSATDSLKATGIPTRTTPTLTPTTLRNIEQLFELPTGQPPESHFNQAGFVPPKVQLSSGSSSFEYISIDNKALGGGVTTLAQPISPSSSSRSCSPMPSLSLSKGTSSGRKMGGRKPKFDDSASPEEEEKRQLRRERNKEAAARCRKRRMDQTSRLQDETDVLEDKKEGLQQEIQSLQQQREDLEFLLAAHKPSCKRDSRIDNSHCSSPYNSLEIKEEPIEDDITMAEPKPRRPTSLALGSSRSMMADLGIAIETPSSGLRGLGLNFESMMEGGTGLTPVSAGTIPPHHTGMTPLTTPIVTAVPSSTNCSSQQRSNELSSPDSGPPKLVSL